MLLFTGPAIAWAAEDMVLEFVRHGQSEANEAELASTAPPGPDLTDVGQEQAHDVGNELFDEYGPDYFDGIFASDLIRTQETAAPLADLLGMDVQDLAGLNEIDAGISEGGQESSAEVLLSFAAPALSWTLGAELVPIPGSSDINGVVFNDRFTDAIETMYDVGDINGDGDINDVAFSSELAMVTWTLMNVDNPDFDAILSEAAETRELLSNTGQIEVSGNPDDGWTLISWDGHDVTQDPDLGTDLFVDFRDLITAPQIAGYHIWEAALDSDPEQVWDAVQTGASDVWDATTEFPDAVITDLVNAF